ncbi:MAG: hypothetical protein QNJ48_09060, partial [Desulfobacterales bacterium]|nr:hypothetical protein [Desulfobacterales bacterium]
HPERRNSLRYTGRRAISVHNVDARRGTKGDRIKLHQSFLLAVGIAIGIGFRRDDFFRCNALPASASNAHSTQVGLTISETFQLLIGQWKGLRCCQANCNAHAQKRMLRLKSTWRRALAATSPREHAESICIHRFLLPSGSVSESGFDETIYSGTMPIPIAIPTPKKNPEVFHKK